MRIVAIGGTGLVGPKPVALLLTAGREVLRRRPIRVSTRYG
jgi:hypothetical protein